MLKHIANTALIVELATLTAVILLLVAPWIGFVAGIA